MLLLNARAVSFSDQGRFILHGHRAARKYSQEAAARNAVSSIAAGAHAAAPAAGYIIERDGAAWVQGPVRFCWTLHEAECLAGPRSLLATRALPLPVSVQPLTAARATLRREKARCPTGTRAPGGGSLAQPRRSSRSAWFMCCLSLLVATWEGAAAFATILARACLSSERAAPLPSLCSSAGVRSPPCW